MASACASLYERYLAPRLVHGACSLNVIAEQRRRVVPRAEGVVLEVGIGSGLNLPHYDASRVTRVIGVDPDATLLRIGRKRLQAAPFEIEVLRGSAEDMPLEAATADTALVTYTLCTIPEVERALVDIRRVLKPEGRLHFCEHGRSHNPRAAKWQDRLTPLWRRMAGGCHLNRPVSRLIEAAGFTIESVDNYKLPLAPELIGFHYLGTARPR